MSDVSRLLSELEAAWLDPAVASTEQLTRLLAKRQDVLASLQKADTTWLDPEAREQLAQRLRAVIERDARLQAVVRTRSAELQDKIDRSLHAREAARSYRGGVHARRAGFDRRA